MEENRRNLKWKHTHRVVLCLLSMPRVWRIWLYFQVGKNCFCLQTKTEGRDVSLKWKTFHLQNPIRLKSEKQRTSRIYCQWRNVSMFAATCSGVTGSLCGCYSKNNILISAPMSIFVLESVTRTVLGWLVSPRMLISRLHWKQTTVLSLQNPPFSSFWITEFDWCVYPTSLQRERTRRRMEKDPHDIGCKKPCGLHNIPRVCLRETDRGRGRGRAGEREWERKRGDVLHWNSCNMTGSILLERKSMAQNEGVRVTGEILHTKCNLWNCNRP